MLHDELFVNITTGELLPGREAIRQFYKVDGHGALDAWTDEWRPTGEQADTLIPQPDFTRIF